MRTRTTSSRTTRRKAAPPPPPPPPAEPAGDAHVALATKYARDVISGAVPACRFVKAACKRQLRDLEKFAGPDSKFYFDEKQAGRACRFIELLPHVKGPKAKDNQKIKLEPWQAFVVTTLFGWRRRDTNGRRFKRSYLEVPRGNAKSTLSSAIGLYCTGSDGEAGAEVYSAATTRDQAKIVFGDAQAMLRKERAFAEKLGLIVNQHLIFQTRSNSKFEALSREAGTMDGKNVHLAIIDELHAHKTREVYDVIETASAKRLSSLIWVITTAGSDVSGICYELRTFCVKLLDGVVEDDSQFAIIYTVDEGDDWTDPVVWRKANPNWDVSVIPEVFTDLAKKAMQIPSAQNNFKTKHLNIWVSADVAWMSDRAWDACADASLDEEQFKQDVCYGGLDLASKTDMAGFFRLYEREQEKAHDPTCLRRTEGGEFAACTCGCEGVMEKHYYGFLTSYLPEAALTDGRNASYAGWEVEGWIKTTPGDVLDFSVVKQDLLEWRDACPGLREVGYDPWQATQLAQECVAEGIQMVEVRATVQNFSAPMKEWDALVRSGRFHHNGNPVLRWMISNVVCHYDAKENVYPRKQKPENKIDGVVAGIMAESRALVYVDDVTPYTPTRGFLTL